VAGRGVYRGNGTGDLVRQQGGSRPKQSSSFDNEDSIQLRFEWSRDKFQHMARPTEAGRVRQKGTPTHVEKKKKKSFP